ncbi:endoglucanase [Selenomonas sp. KH1T6]|nr:endoglucanase [Selenomonas ruminantium]
MMPATMASIPPPGLSQQLSCCWPMRPILSLDKSFLTGAGANPPEHPHNRIHESTGAYVPGLLVGGPNAVIGGDPDQTKYLESGHVPTAKSYLDVLSSWSTNE